MAKLEGEGLVRQLERAILESGESYRELHRATGVQASSISRFMDGQLHLRLDKADALARHLGLVLRKGKGR
jgi:plasmid maintenance system antidote protein VapI